MDEKQQLKIEDANIFQPLGQTFQEQTSKYFRHWVWSKWGGNFFVTFYNYGITISGLPDDGGNSWTAIEGDLPDLPVLCILQNPLLPSELIIGTKLGVWSSYYTATNVEWSQSYNGMSDVTVIDLDLRPRDNTILATTHGRGMLPRPHRCCLCRWCVAYKSILVSNNF